MDISIDGKKRCFGGVKGKEFYAKYHDEEWGIPVHDDVHLFEMLILEGAQAGLSWETVLKKREGYSRAFYDWDIEAISVMNDEELEKLRSFEGIIRNKLKIYSTRKNARVFLDIQKEFESFDNYLWRFVGGDVIVNNWGKFEDVPVTTDISDALSKDLKKRGMSFVGSTIMYAYMQAVGMVDDHLNECWCRSK